MWVSRRCRTRVLFRNGIRWCSRMCSSPEDIRFFEGTMKQRFFFYPTAALYGSTSGLFDLGPHGAALKWKLLEQWKKVFIELDENIYPIETSSIVPEKVLSASGHVDKFQDVLVKDTVTSEYIRVDHMIQEHLLKNPPKDESFTWEKIQKIVYSNNMTNIKNILKELGLTKNPETNNELSDPIEFNLMFQTKIGVEGSRNAFLRPEIAQGIFTNFVHLLRQTDGSLPFGVGSVGNVFRNETSARQGLLRTREFTLAEIEFFFHPNHPQHPNFSQVNPDFQLPILSAKQQGKSMEIQEMACSELLKNNLVSNEIVVYYMYKAYNFLVQCGVDSSRIRFRQHLSDEMAHYAADCWDIEIETTQYGWIECVGIANRTNYDLSKHIEHSKRGNQLMVFVPFPEGETYKETVTEVKPIQPLFGKTFKNLAPVLSQYLKDMLPQDISALQKKLDENSECLVQIEGNDYNITKDMLSFIQTEVTRSGEHVIPHVIEPSFGISRILYCILEHNFRIRSVDEARSYLSLPPLLAPITCEVLVMKRSEKYLKIMDKIVEELTRAGIKCRRDTKSRSIGKRYAVTDEIGTPFVVTIDDVTEHLADESMSKATVTLRERNSMVQKRISLAELPGLLLDLSQETIHWDDVNEKE